MKNKQITLNYSVSGSARQNLVRAIAKHTGEKSKYLGAPKFEYQVGGIIVGSQGEVTFPAGTKVKTITELVKALVTEGFETELPALEDAPKAPKKAQAPAKTAKAAPKANQPVPADEGEKVALTVAVPADKVNMENLVRLLEAKGALIKKALGIEATFLKVENDTVTFDWFGDNTYTADEVNAYTRFIAALCEMSVNQARVTAKEKPVDNEKFAFRCFLLRLGFIGDEYKIVRKVLLRNLTGSSAFKSGQRGVTA